MERLRWSEKPICPHCGSINDHYFLTPKNDAGRKTRTGKVSQRRVWKCKDCRKQFSVLTGTIFDGTKIPIRTWIFVVFEMCASKNGIAVRELERRYGLSPKSAWFMTHRIREAMKLDPLRSQLLGTVIADETFIGGEQGNRHKKVRFSDDAPKAKVAVLSLLHKESGEVRSHVVPNVKRDTLRAAIEKQVPLAGTTLHTDSAQQYTRIGWKAFKHETVNHIMSEYVRDGVTTNHVEGYFSQLKRSLDGTYHHAPRSTCRVTWPSSISGTARGRSTTPSACSG